MQQTSMGLSPLIVIAGMLAVLLIVALFAALLSRRFWAVLAGAVGTLVLVAGGLLLVGGFIVYTRSVRRVERVLVPRGGSIEVVEAAPSRSSRPVADMVRIQAEAADPSAGIVFGSADNAASPVENADPRPVGAPRPTWMDGQMGRVGDVYRTTVTIGPAFSRTDCEKLFSQALDDAVRTYADHLLGAGRGQLVELPDTFIQNHLIRNEWEEQRDTTYATIITLHELLEFDREANEAIEANYRQSVVMGRLAYTAAGGGVVLGLLTTLFGWLKLGTLLRGGDAHVARN